MLCTHEYSKREGSEDGNGCGQGHGIAVGGVTAPWCMESPAIFMHPGAPPQTGTYASVIGLIPETNPFNMPTIVDTYRLDGD